MIDDDDRYPEVNIVFEKQAWMNKAGCKGYPTEWWFPERGGVYKAAKEICERCPVRQQCLDYSLTLPNVIGIWGGLSGNQRRAVKSLKPDRPINHGTHSGYVVHRKRGEEPCRECKDAHQRYTETRRRIPNRSM